MAALSSSLRPILLAFASALALASVPSSAQTPASYSIESVKAAFLYRFLEYVEWPESARTDGPLTIAVLDDEALSTELHRNVRGRTAQGREVRVRTVSSVQEGLEAQVLFVSSGSRKKLAPVANSNAHDPVLIVTEGDGALERGSVINFVVVDGNVRFEISLPAAEQRGLKLSSRLLNVALRVEKSGHRFDTPDEDDTYWAMGEHTE